MKIVHRYVLIIDEIEQRRFAAIGVKLPLSEELKARSITASGFIVHKIAEDDPRWSAFHEIAKSLDHGTESISTEFSKEEIDAADHLVMEPLWHHGYPMPDDDDGYQEMTYNTSERCPECGAGAIQKAPFRMRGEPKWGRRSILQLNWIFDEYFIKPEVWKPVFASFGIKTSEVLRNSTGKPLTTVVQLKKTHYCDVELGDHTFEKCLVCGRIKYLPFTIGFFPKPSDRRPFQRTRQWFGSGASARNEVIVSQDLRQAIITAKITGVTFWPCK